MRIGFTAAVAALFISGAASAGTFTPIGDGAGSYSFERCTRPPEPDLAIDAALKGRERVKAHNDKVKAYNAHVAEMNAYMVCLSGEAERDMQLYYQAVSSSLDAEQNSVLDALAAKAKDLDIRVRN